MAIITPANLGQGTLTAAAVAYATASGASKVITAAVVNIFVSGLTA